MFTAEIKGEPNAFGHNRVLQGEFVLSLLKIQNFTAMGASIQCIGETIIELREESPGGWS